MTRKDEKEELLRIIHEYSLNPNTREIYLNGNVEDITKESSEIDYKVSTVFIKNLNFLVSRSKESPIIIHLSTIGGDYGAGISIFDAISTCPCYIYIIVHGEAYSIGSLILQAADMRIMMPNAYCMIHEGSIEIPSSTNKVANSTVTWSKDITAFMLNLYAERCINGEYFKEGEKTEREIKKFIQNKIDKKEDWFLTAKETVYYGFADEIIGENSKYKNINEII
jgi:ATP-dependent Clp protease protease subunit